MKIIDILNKIANGEEVPKKIIFRDRVYHWVDGVDYSSDSGQYLLQNEPICPEFLNDEVEIEITLNTKDMNITSSEIKPSTYTIEKLELPRYFNEGDGEDFTIMLNMNRNIVAIKNKINEIIDKLNKEVK